MTLSVDGNPQSYTGTGADTPLGTVFLFFTATDVVVTQRITATGVDATLVKDTHYTLTGGSSVGATGTVTPITGATNFTTAMTWTISRSVPLTQSLDYIANDGFPAASHETALDRITMQVQDIEEQADRSLRFPLGDQALTSEIPSAVDRALQALTFDASGNVTVSARGVPLGAKTLLATATGAAAAKVTLTLVNWPATYDSVELEFIGIRGSAPAAMEIQPIDSAVATTTNLEVNIATHIGVAIAGADNADWATSSSYLIGTSADDWLTGDRKSVV